MLSIIAILSISIYAHWVNSSQPVQSSQAVNTNSEIKVFTQGWAVAVALLQLNHPPTSIGDKRMYPVWVDRPTIPKTVIDSGTRGMPNLELVVQLEPDFILDIADYNRNLELYMPNTPIYDIDFNKNNQPEKKKQWSTLAKDTQQIGLYLQQPQKAKQYIAKSKQRIAQAGAVVHNRIGDKKLLVVDMWDSRKLGVDTINSFSTLAVEMMGLKTLEIGGGGQWASASKPMHMLYELPKDTCLIVTGPIPAMTKYDIEHSLIWQHSFYSQPNSCVYFIDPVLSSGGVDPLVTFAENLEKAVTTQTTNEFSYEYLAGKAVTATEAAQ